jgi:hypothetical protein
MRLRSWLPGTRRRRSMTSFKTLRVTRNTSNSSKMMLRLIRRNEKTLPPAPACGLRISHIANASTATPQATMRRPSRRRRRRSASTRGSRLSERGLGWANCT